MPFQKYSILQQWSVNIDSNPACVPKTEEKQLII